MGAYLPEKEIPVPHDYPGSRHGGYRVYRGQGQVRSGGRVEEYWQPLVFVRQPKPVA